MKTLLKSLAFAAACTIIFVSCQKEQLSENITVTVVNKGTSIPISYAKVHLLDNEWVNDGTIFNEIETLVTDGSGRCTFPRSSGAEFVLASSENYLEELQIRKPVLREEEIELELSAHGWLNLHIIHFGDDNNEEDWIRLYPGFIDMPSSQRYVFEGAFVQEDLSGMVKGGQGFEIRYTIKQNGQYEFHRETLYCQPFDTLNYVISY